MRVALLRFSLTFALTDIRAYSWNFRTDDAATDAADAEYARNTKCKARSDVFAIVFILFLQTVWMLEVAVAPFFLLIEIVVVVERLHVDDISRGRFVTSAFVCSTVPVAATVMFTL